MRVTDIRRCYEFGADAASRQVASAEGVRCELLCLEAGQGAAAAGPAAFYVVEGTAVLSCGEQVEHVSAGGVAAAGAGETVRVSNASLRRVVVMKVTSG